MRWIAIVLLAALAGCAAPVARERFYTLSGPPPAAIPAAAATSTLSVFVGPVTVPEDVDRTPMVLRTGPHRVEIDELSRWAEPLKSGIARVLAEALSSELGTPRVRSGRGNGAFPADVRVALEVRRFESSLADGATIDALWTITGPKAAARTGRSVVTERSTSGDAEGVAAAHGRALARIASEIAAALRSS